MSYIKSLLEFFERNSSCEEHHIGIATICNFSLLGQRGLAAYTSYEVELVAGATLDFIGVTQNPKVHMTDRFVIAVDKTVASKAIDVEASLFLNPTFTELANPLDIININHNKDALEHFKFIQQLQ